MTIAHAAPCRGLTHAAPRRGLTPAAPRRGLTPAALCRGLTAATAAGFILLLAAHPASAALAGEDPFAAFEPVSHEVMKQARGGMMIGGMTIDFAVVVGTTAQTATGQLAGLTTTLAINNAGGVGSAVTTASGGPATLTTTGARMSLDNDATSIMQQVINNQVQTLISNMANGITLSHTTTIDVTLPNFVHTNSVYSSQISAAQIGMEAALHGIGH